MLKRVEPLRDELQSLEDQAELNMKSAQDTKDLITQLEQSIAAYKEEYAQLISQAQAIKTDLENVQAKVDRSIALLESLNIERDRWEETSETFRSQMSTIVGDVLLSAAFIAYGNFNGFFFLGFFDVFRIVRIFSNFSNFTNIQNRIIIKKIISITIPSHSRRLLRSTLPKEFILHVEPALASGHHSISSRYRIDRIPLQPR